MATHPPVPTQREAFIVRFRHLGLRVTPQRLLVLEALAASGGHMTADEIMRWTAQRYPAINLATIYRTLDLLTSVGLVTQTDLGGGASKFEITGDTPHHHLVCEHCGYVMEVDDALLVPMRERLLREYGFRASARHIGLFGVCEACLEASRAHPVGREEQRPTPTDEARAMEHPAPEWEI